MYDVLIIGAGMSGLAAGIRLAQFGAARCHSRTAYDDRRPQFVLSPRWPKLRRRAARRNQLPAARAPNTGRCRACCGSCACHGTNSSWFRKQLPPSRFPASGLNSATIIALLESEVARQFPRPDRQLPPPCRRADPVRRTGGALVPLLPREQCLANSSPTRFWSRCCSARCCTTAAHASTTRTSARQASCSAASSSRVLLAP